MSKLSSILHVKSINPVISYKNLRRLIGILGMILPLICFLGGYIISHLKLGPSISSYYYTNVRDVFVGIMVGVSMFLLTYRGYELIDTIVSTITGIAGLGIALFPCFNMSVTTVGFFQLPVGLSSVFHIICAALFFLLLAINSIFIFTQTDTRKKMSDNKRKRNIIFIACGIIIFVCLIILVVLNIVMPKGQLEQTLWVFVLETILLEAFGISWLVKGETILKD